MNDYQAGTDLRSVAGDLEVLLSQAFDVVTKLRKLQVANEVVGPEIGDMVELTEDYPFVTDARTRQGESHLRRGTSGQLMATSAHWDSSLVDSPTAGAFWVPTAIVKKARN